MVGLHEAIEDARLGIGADADAGVANLETQPHGRAGFVNEADADRNLALLGELDRVGREVQQDLPKVMRVALEVIFDRGVDQRVQPQSLALRMRAQELHEPVQERVKVEVGDLDREPAGFDLRDVEHVVDERSHHADGVAEQAQELALLRIEPRGMEEVDDTHDAVQRRAHLVAHVREERALRPVGLFRLGARLLDPGEEGRHVQRQHDQRDEQVPPGDLLGLPIRREQQGGGKAGEAERLAREQIPASVAEAVAEGDEEVHPDHADAGFVGEEHDERRA